jgi:hypothetical protein
MSSFPMLMSCLQQQRGAISYVYIYMSSFPMLMSCLQQQRGAKGKERAGGCHALWAGGGVGGGGREGIAGDVAGSLMGGAGGKSESEGGEGWTVGSRWRLKESRVMALAEREGCVLVACAVSLACCLCMYEAVSCVCMRP